MARQRGLSFYRRKKKINAAVVREIFSWLFGICLAVFIGIVLVWFFGMTTAVVGDSMNPLLYSGQEVLLDRFSYIISSPKAGDVVVFLPNGNDKSHFYIKRVVAGPGDHVVIEDEKLYVNGKLTPWFSEEKILEAGYARNEVTMSRGEYFCIGDNVNNSEDSRSANIGPVKEEDIVGKVWFAKTTRESHMKFVK